ncbi:hypothetical protein JW848_01070 [Candidatus Bipolaricaulota bacterium]|nr:hypothetical protein [Candidatus Bipolaricaulota bacterium]
MVSIGKASGELALVLAALLVAVSGFAAANDGAPAGPAGNMDLSGTWWEVQRFVDRAEMPIFGELRRETTAVMRVEIVQSGSQLVLKSSYCGAGVETAVPGLRMVFPEAFVRALVSGDRHARLEASDDSALLGFEQEWYVEIRGATVADPLHDPLPESADDPRVVDQDGDGHPGMTVGVDLLGLIRGEVYVVQRVRYRLVGWVEPNGGSISGRIEWNDEQVVLGASSPLLRVESIGEAIWEESSFRFERAGAGLGCEQAPDGGRR